MSTFGLAALNVAAHAADEALASRDTTSSNLEDIFDGDAYGSGNPLVLVDDTTTTLRLRRRT